MVRPTGDASGVSFVIRLWLEQRERAAQPEWRFEVRHVQSDARTHCRRLADVLAFVECHAGVAPPPFAEGIDLAPESRATEEEDMER